MSLDQWTTANYIRLSFSSVATRGRRKYTAADEPRRLRPESNRGHRVCVRRSLKKTLQRFRHRNLVFPRIFFGSVRYFRPSCYAVCVCVCVCILRQTGPPKSRTQSAKRATFSEAVSHVLLSLMNSPGTQVTVLGSKMCILGPTVASKLSKGVMNKATRDHEVEKLI